MTNHWMCGARITCRDGELVFADHDGEPGLYVNVCFTGMRLTEDGDLDFDAVVMTDDFEIDHVELAGRARLSAERLFRSRTNLYDEALLIASYDAIGAV